LINTRFVSDKKGVGSKILGIFVEDAAGAPAEAPAPPPPAAPLAGMKADRLTVAVGAPADFDAVFREAGMDAADLDRVKKAEELLRTLPEATPQPVKKQIVEASLKAFGFEIERIIASAQNQKRALDAYVKVNESATAKALQDAEAQIRTLNERIAALRADIEKRTVALSTLAATAQQRKAVVQQVMDFFQTPAAAPKP